MTGVQTCALPISLAAPPAAAQAPKPAKAERAKLAADHLTAKWTGDFDGMVERRMIRGLFAFASYNAGAGRVAGLRNEAVKRGLDPNVWFNNVELVAAEKIGRETVTYRVQHLQVLRRLRARPGRVPRADGGAQAVRAAEMTGWRRAASTGKPLRNAPGAAVPHAFRAHR